ncbi:MAG: hypothetical protein MZU97_14830 [Bacillus subtilis]|nr:hypothetical protein [Bacillus subtilis]
MLLQEKLIEKTIATGLSTGADFAEVFIEDTASEGIQLVGGRVEKASGTNIFGVGVRRRARDIQQRLRLSPTARIRTTLVKLASDLSKSLSKANTLTAPVPLGKLEVGTRHKVEDQSARRRAGEEGRTDEGRLRRRQELRPRDRAGRDHARRLGPRTSRSPTAKAVMSPTNAPMSASTSSAVAGKDGVMQTGGEGPGAGQGIRVLLRRARHQGSGQRCRPHREDDALRRRLSVRHHARHHQQQVRRRHLPRSLRPLARSDGRREERLRLLRQAQPAGRLADRHR